MVDKTVGADTDGNNVFNLVVAAINKVLKVAQTSGVNGKYQIMELCMRAWLSWSAYQEEHNQLLLADLEALAEEIMTLLG